MPFAVQTENKRFHWILRAALSVLVADCAIAAIFAGDTASYQKSSRVSGNSPSLSEVEWAIVAVFCNRMMQEWRKLAFNVMRKPGSTRPESFFHPLD
jgi:hypothetical protein